MERIKKFLPLLITAVLAAVLYSYRIEISFEADQPAARILMAQSSVFELVFHNPDARHPFIIYILLHYVSMIFGMGEAPARMISVFWGILSVVALYSFLKDHTSWMTAFAGACFLALSVQFAEQARDIGNFSMFVFFSIMSSTYLFRLILKKSKSNTIDGSLYAISSFLMSFSNYFFVFVLGSQALFLIYLRLTEKKLDRAVVKYSKIAYALCFPAFCLLVSGFVSDEGSVKQAAISRFVSWGNQTRLDYLKDIVKYFINIQFYDGELFYLLQFILAIAAGIAIIFIFAYLMTDFEIKKHPLLIYPIIMTVISIGTTLASVSSARLKPSYLIFLYPFWSVFLFAGLEVLIASQNIKDKDKKLILLSLLAVMVTFQAMTFYDKGGDLYASKRKYGIQELIEYIRKNKSESSFVVFEKNPYKWLLYYYGYDNPRDVFLKAMYTDRDIDGRNFVYLPELSFQSIIPTNNFKDAADLETKSFNFLLNIKRKPYWFFYNKEMTLPSVKKYINENCKLRLENTKHSLFFCEK